MGTTALIGGTMFMVMFVAGSSVRILAPLAISGLLMTWELGSISKARSRAACSRSSISRNTRKPTASSSGRRCSPLAPAGWTGSGLGNGVEKISYLPFAHTDFIFPMIGEELGLRSTLGVVFCYLLIVRFRHDHRGAFARPFRDAVRLRSRGHAGAAGGAEYRRDHRRCCRTRACRCPFISYGGSNLVFCLLGVGILINIYRQGIADSSEPCRHKTLSARVTPRLCT